MKESLRALKTNIQFCGDDIRTLLVTSSVPNEGKSTVALDLARSLTESGNRVLFIDTDMRKSVLAGRLRATAASGGEICGLSHYLSGQRRLEEVMYGTEIPGLFMIFAGPSVPNPTEILEKKGLIATAGIGTNLYLCKIAMDIVAKHMEPDDNGVRIAELDEISYRELLWDHRPLTDFWRVGAGYRKKLEAAGMFTMGDVARCSIGGPGDYYNEDLLYRMFGINAELLIDHAWGYEPVTMDLIKSYRPETNCISSGQVLHCATDFMQAKIVVREMAEQLAMDLVEKKLVTDQIVLTVGYDIDNLKIPEIADHYHGEITVDRYGRSVPKHAHGTGNLDAMTASVSRITETTMGLYERIVDPMLLTRRITLVANHLKDADSVKEEPFYEQLDLFSGGFLQTGQKETSRETKQLEKERLEKEKHLQEAMLSVKSKYGKNAILKAADLQEGATTIDRNRQIGGHKA